MRHSDDMTQETTSNERLWNRDYTFITELYHIAMSWLVQHVLCGVKNFLYICVLNIKAEYSVIVMYV